MPSAIGNPNVMSSLQSVLETIEVDLLEYNDAEKNGVAAILVVVAKLKSHLLTLQEKDEQEATERKRIVLPKAAAAIFSFYRFIAGFGPQMSSTDLELQEALDECLGLCGLHVTFIEILRCLKELASVDPLSNHTLHSQKIVPLQSLFASLRILRQILFLSHQVDQQMYITKKGHRFALQRLIQEYADYDQSTFNNSYTALDELVKSLVLLPVKIATACHAAKLHLPPWAKRDKYAPSLVEIAAYQASTIEGSEKILSARSYFLSSLIRVMVRYGGSPDVAVGLHNFWSASSRSQSVDIFRNLMKSIYVTTDCVCLIQAMLRLSVAQLEILPIGKYIESRELDMASQQCMPFLKDTCLGVLQESDMIRDEFVRVMILSPSPSCDIFEQRILIRCICNLLYSCKYNVSDTSIEDSRNKCLIEYMEKVAFIWCTPRFISGTCEKQQSVITEFLLLAMNHLEQKTSHEAQVLVEMLTSGVSNRLASSISSVRKDGMRIGEKIATLLGQELKFDELDDERDNKTNVEVEATFPSKSIGLGGRVPVKNMIDRSERRRKAVDPDEELSSDADDCAKSIDLKQEVDNLYLGDDDSDWEEDHLIPYDMKDDEQDLHQVQKPKYLRDCLEMLRCTGDDFPALCSMETAMQQLPLLIQDNPSDLKLYAESLTKELLRIQNRFDLDSFGELRFDSLCALTVKEPITVSRYLCEEVFQDDVIMDMRLDILHVLRCSSTELSGVFTLNNQESDTKKVYGKRKLVQLPALDEFDNNIDGEGDKIDMMRDTTRRWGKGRKNVESQTVVNTFASIAPYFFYPLLDGFMKSRQKLTIWKGHNGSFFLSQVLLCLSTFLKNTSSPTAVIMASDLFELAWALHDAEDSVVRKSVLLSMIICCRHFGQDKIVSIVRDAQFLDSFLKKTKVQDSDDDCRRLSLALLHIFGTYSIE